ncbi:Endonuclease, Uma2 family (restriction endonuclease fold) [Desulfacinum infernum DSM 9756]|jgi:Uma2 family endonuclease|uniref:Endonuclease, Uma2 family (Restriction endonuclease fold) n=1 Tax=Desulfacinum infernum DSM 9756 TaxID=1121391 RepID=A0A1M5GEC2_9BACT|nr:Uma2 family endonuclease [Desulfacinum infernum]SHG01841.1 Endonuclease, Uma2 family (restriction endonuclease fold) [Desulfacinum infernum DSM 9756]
MPVGTPERTKVTYQDYLSWPDDERWEILDGVPFAMTPSPSPHHQRICRNVAGELYLQREGLGECEIFLAPTDVVLDPHNVVQPDILVLCGRDQITAKNIQGVPDLVVEVVSPSTEIKDRREKKRLYERHGVKEYIIVFPEREYVERYHLSQGSYGGPDLFNWNESLDLLTFPIRLDLWKIFEKTPPEKSNTSENDV